MVETNSEFLVEIRDVTYTHWNHTEPTLKGLSLAIRRGTFNVLVGPGGSGKSTICDLLSGKIPHLMGGELEGEVWVDGINTRSVEVKDLALKVGHVFQDPESMFATLTVEDEIAFGPENLMLEVDEIRQTVETLLETAQLKPFRSNLVWNLSGGQVQRLGLSAILSMQPKMIVLDEPTANLDPVATRSVHELILSLREAGMTILLVTRELDDFLASADQLLVLDAGTVIAAGKPADVLRTAGQKMVENLGVWLPETSEIGIALQKTGSFAVKDIPITVDEAVCFLKETGLLKDQIIGKPAPAEVETAGELLITANNLTYTYPGEIHALKGVSLEIRAGEMLAIVGRNGAGKSTLAKLLVGLLKPGGGELNLFGKPAQQWKVQELANQIALVFQNPEHQFLTDTVEDEIGYSLLARGMTSAAERQKTINETLELLGLSLVAKAHPFSLSAGMKRRLGVATMLVCRPRVLVVDEPTYGQDKQMTQTLMEITEGIRSQGIAVVMITHDMRLVQEYASRVIVMSEGQVRYNGSPAGLFGREDILKSANLRPTILLELLAALKAQGIQICGEIPTTSAFLDALLPERSAASYRQEEVA
ncbi:MAG: energy-coupling factor ABC transporter ATP-binding protein [Chloroflexi bacterium]|nr:energy-coupling factor ABC transporter ATP-binding protein [Chloroflexota bacterium]